MGKTIADLAKFNIEWYYKYYNDPKSNSSEKSTSVKTLRIIKNFIMVLNFTNPFLREKIIFHINLIILRYMSNYFNL